MERIETAHERSRKTYGSPRIHADIRDQGVPVGQKRIARLMKAEGLVGVSRRKGTRTTVRDESDRQAPDLVGRSFTATGPNQLWVADITYVPTWSGFLFLAIVLDVWSRRVVDWAMETHLRTELVLQALNMAVSQRRPTQVIHPLNLGSTRPWPLGSGAREQAFRFRWDRWATVMTMRWRRHFLRPSKRSSWTVTAFGVRGRPERWSSSTLRAGTTPTAGIQLWGISHRPSSSRTTAPRWAGREVRLLSRGKPISGPKRPPRLRLFYSPASRG